MSCVVADRHEARAPLLTDALLMLDRMRGRLAHCDEFKEREMSRTVPPGYMDTSDVRRVAELKVKACVSTPRKYTHVDCAVDNEFVKLVSPMNQKKRSDMMEQKSESLTGINKILLVVVMVCAIYRFAIAPNYGFFSLPATSLVPQEAPSLPLNRVETNTLHNQDASSTKTTTRTSNERHPYFEGLLSQQCISSEIKKCYESSSSLLKLIISNNTHC